ncbi:helix-turn-helix transcriptional regulator [Marinobacterium sp. BA1]|uniref:helix-turn-helix transcriptional regulator n=1 Tax=Marinobacterium sp. BA1 TaxID=3138931 RepID=UPI0032E65339
MITRTEHGYALNGWEARPMPLPSGAKFTAGESRAAVCRVNGLKASEAAQELHCSRRNIDQYWQTLYYKLGCNNAIVAINKLVELGALHRINTLLLALILGTGSALDTDLDIEARAGRVRSSQTRTARRGGRRSGMRTNRDMMTDLDMWTNGSASDIYTLADLAS